MRDLIESIRIEYGTEAALQTASVLRVVRNKIIQKNLFGWREFIEDVLIDLAGYMIITEFKYSGGAYVACGMQSAIDACRYCNAAKRRGNYETISIYLVEGFMDKASVDYFEQVTDLVIEIKDLLGDDVADHLEQYLRGKILKISKEVVNRCKTPEFESWLKNYRGKLC